jgi:hypothetical protein
MPGLIDDFLALIAQATAPATAQPRPLVDPSALTSAMMGMSPGAVYALAMLSGLGDWFAGPPAADLDPALAAQLADERARAAAMQAGIRPDDLAAMATADASHVVRTMTRGAPGSGLVGGVAGPPRPATPAERLTRWEKVAANAAEGDAIMARRRAGAPAYERAIAEAEAARKRGDRERAEAIMATIERWAEEDRAAERQFRRSPAEFRNRRTAADMAALAPIRPSISL